MWGFRLGFMIGRPLAVLCCWARLLAGLSFWVWLSAISHSWVELEAVLGGCVGLLSRFIVQVGATSYVLPLDRVTGGKPFLGNLTGCAEQYNIIEN